MAEQLIQFNMPPRFAWQEQVRTCPVRFRVVAAARQVGKSRLAGVECLSVALKGGKVWWVVPEHGLADQIFELLSDWARAIPEAKVRKSKKSFEFPTGGTIQIKSADDPQRLRGATLDFVVMDECAFMHEAAWYEGVRHTLTVKKGRALFTSTTFGKNWFYQLYVLGLPNNPSRDPEWMSFRFDQTASPLITQDEIESARRTMPHNKFRQEVMAEFTDGGGEVFTGVTDVATLAPQTSPLEGHSYVFGIDWGSAQDFTSITIIDETMREMASLFRMSEPRFETVWDTVEEIYNFWKPRICVVETNNIGSVSYQELENRGLRLKPFNTNPQTKRGLIDAWTVAIEQKQCYILNEAVLINEHMAYEYQDTAHGRRTYNSPRGGHDDTVISSALAWHGVLGDSEPAVGFVRAKARGLYGYNPAKPNNTPTRTYPTWRQSRVAKPLR